MAKIISKMMSLETYCKTNNKEYLLDEWDYNKNSIAVNSISYGTNKKVWWLCDKNHSWEANVNSRVRGNGCPYCSNQYILKGYNDFQSWCEEKDLASLLEEWNYEKNKDVTPDSVGKSSKTKVWWKCKKGHEWNSSIVNRSIKGGGCPYCSNSKTLKGYNDLKTIFPDIAAKWDYERNVLRPEDVSFGSGKKVYWICDKGHSWEAIVHNIVKGRGCPICANKKIVSGINDFVTWCKNNGNQVLLKEWDYDKNSINPSEISYGSTKKVWWKCSKNHSFSQSINSRTNSKTGCPYCNGYLLKGFNDLETYCKENNQLQILEDWDYEKNSLMPNEVAYGSDKKVWFKCHICRYEWTASVVQRTRNHTNCRMCARRSSSSFPEQSIYYYISKCFPDTLNGDRDALDGLELDIFIPSLKVAIEYDGREWHKKAEKDLKKDLLCKDKGILLYRIRENGCQELVSNDSIQINYEYENWKELNIIIKKVLSDLGVDSIDINIERDEYIIREQYYKKVLENSLLNKYPDIAKDWMTEKNKVTPDLVYGTGHVKYWWLCPDCGHEYKTSISSRTRMGSGCPECARIKIALSQATKILNIDTKEIFDSINVAAVKYDIHRSAISYCLRGVTKTAGGYRWTYYETGLHSKPKDISSRVKPGVNDLETYCINNNKEYILNEWNYDENVDSSPSMIAYGSMQKVSWKCSKGHVWLQTPGARTNHNRNCPYCANQLVYTGFNDLETINPKLAKEWNYNKNSEKPSLVIAGSGKKYWWICSRKHEWEASISDRSRGDGCPYCSNRKVITGFNDVATTNPAIAEEWDYEKNGEDKPTMYSKGTAKKFWWKCEKGHSFYKSLNDRTSGRGCPYCANKQVLPGFNDLITWCNNNKCQYIIEEWNYKKNKLKPDQYLKGSHKKVWWICSKGHEYEQIISSRTYQKHGCPYCSGRKKM